MTLGTHSTRRASTGNLHLFFFFQCHRSNQGAHSDQTLWVDSYYMRARAILTSSVVRYKVHVLMGSYFICSGSFNFVKFWVSDAKLGTSMHLDRAFKMSCKSLTWVACNTWSPRTGHLHLCYPFRALCQISERTYFIIGLLFTSLGRHVLLRSPELRRKAHVLATETF